MIFISCLKNSCNFLFSKNNFVQAIPPRKYTYKLYSYPIIINIQFELGPHRPEDIQICSNFRTYLLCSTSTKMLFLSPLLNSVDIKTKETTPHFPFVSGS